MPGSGTAVNDTLSTTPGAPGETRGERNGDGGVNNYNRSDSATHLLDAPSVDKLVPDDTTYTIGETFVYDLVVTVPEGESRDLTVIDNAPPGLELLSFEVITEASLSNNLLSSDFAGMLPASPTVNNVAGSGGDLTLGFGDVVNAPDQNPDNDHFLIRVTAQVLNEIANQNGVILTNEAAVEYDDPGTGLPVNVPDPTPVDITLVEPVLALEKSVVSGATSGLDGGDRVTYRVSVTNLTVNGSAADAFDALFTDTLPDSMSVTRNAMGMPNITIVTGPTALSTADFTVSSVNAGTDNAITSNAFDLALGETLTLEYQVILDTAITESEMLTNNSGISWTTLAGANPEERGPGDSLLDEGGLNDYELGSDATVSIAPIDFV